MTDRELLELAAKAVGLNDLTYFDEGAAGGKGMRRDELDWDNWNPLENDGDALRLAVKVGLQRYFGLEVQRDCVQATCLEPWEHCEYEDFKGQDPCDATRRSIVRVAAAIGREMK